MGSGKNYPNINFFLNGLLIIVLSVFVSIFLKTNSRYKETQNSYPLMHVIFLS